MPNIRVIISEMSNFIKDGKVTFLVGPGISQPKPTCLPNPQEIISELLKIFYQKNPTLQRLFCNEKDFEESIKQVRFEEFLQILEDNTGKLEILNIFRGGIPNPIHYFLARCLLFGNHIITTCIDDLIEKAYDGSDLKVFQANDNFESALLEMEKGKVPFALFKVRGSISNSGSLNVTADQIGRSGIGFVNEETKAEFFDKLIEKRHLVVLGYPGTDEFDIIPRLIYQKPRKKIFWLDHQPMLISLDPPEKGFEKNPNWEKIALKKELLVLLYGDLLDSVKTLSEKIFGSMTEPLEETDTGSRHDLNLNELISRQVEVWGVNHTGLLEMISGLLLYEGNHRNEACECFLDAEKAFGLNSNGEGAARAMTNLSVIYSDQQNYDKVIEYLEKSWNIYMELEDVPGLAVTDRNIASVLLSLGEWKKALSQFEESGTLYKQCEDWRGYAGVTNTMAQICTDFGEYEKATKYFYESNKFYKKCGDMKGYALSLGNCGA